MSDTCRFFVPGPTWVREEILQEMNRPMIGHRSAAFQAMFTKILSDTRELFGTGANAYVATSSGTGLMEASLVNCVRKRVLVTTCGAFSERWLSIARSLGLEADQVGVEWGAAVDSERLESHLRSAGPYDAVTITQNETSTGVLNDVAELARVIRSVQPEALILVDSVSALGSAQMHFDEWGLDVCFASTQKGLALPPGLTLFAVSERALQRAREKEFRGTYFDFLEYVKSAADGGPAFTPAISLCFALARQLEHILREETLERRWKRHVEMRDLVLERTRSYATPFAAAKYASVSVSALSPTSMSAPALIAKMKERGFTLGSGYGTLKPTTFRIGHLGDITIQALTEMLDNLQEVAGHADAR